MISLSESNGRKTRSLVSGSCNVCVWLLAFVSRVVVVVVVVVVEDLVN